VRNAAEVKAFVDAAVAKYGKLNIAFNNAGIGQPFVEMAEVKADIYADMFATNVHGKYTAMTAEIPHMSANGGASINMSSILGVKAGARAVAYSSTMHAISGMTLGAALELAPKKIRVNGIAPGAITDTDFMVPIMGRRLNAEEIKTFGPLHALGRTGSAKEVAKAMMFLASDEVSFVTGEIMKVDGYFLNG
jgi:NAD(P)-dependent dehydrogenase (short-subunit alcohol dehydrogenase family)